MSAKHWPAWKDSLYVANIQAAYNNKGRAPEAVLNLVIDALQARALRRYYKAGRAERRAQ